MKFEQLMEELLNEYVYDINKRMQEIESVCRGNPQAMVDMLLTDLRYSSGSSRDPILDVLHNKFGVTPEEADKRVADQKAPKGEVSGTVGIPPRSKSLERFMSRERNA